SRRRLLGGGRDRLAGAPQATPSRCRRRRRGCDGSSEADQRRPRLAVRPGPAGTLRPGAGPEAQRRQRRGPRPIHLGPAAGRAPGAARGPRRRPAADPEEALQRHLDRVERLTPDEIDRLSLAQTPPIAFVASIARFLPPELLARVDAVEGRVHERLPRAVRWNTAVRDSAIGVGHDLVLGGCLAGHRSEPFRGRVHERLPRGWSAAVDQPRYGPNGDAVARAITALRALPAAELGALAAAATRSDGSTRANPPWPPGLRP